MLAYIFGFSFIIITYIWILYPLVMYLWSKLHPGKKISNTQKNFKISVLIAGLNEESAIESRIDDIFSGDYPSENLQVIVISDGSTDNTVLSAKKAKEKWGNVTIIENPEKSGRAIAHNNGVKVATGEILVFTDAGTRFAKDFLKTITSAFNDPKIGFASGALIYINVDESDITKAVGIYWRFEQALRRWESKVGVNVFGSGACCSMRKELYRDIPPTGDVDFTSPLDTALQGFRCAHVDQAFAYDEMPDSRADELRARIRMTSKNFQGTLGRWGIRGLVKHPILSWVILSHKYGRWITPFIMLLALISSLGALFINGGIFWTLCIALQILFYSMGLAGKLGFTAIPGASSIYSFLLSTYGNFHGVMKVITGQVAASYTPMRRESVND